MEFVKDQLPSQDETEQFFKSLPVQIQPRFARLKSAPTPINHSADEDAYIGAKSPIVVAFADGVSAENRNAVMYSVQFFKSLPDTTSWPQFYAKPSYLQLQHTCLPPPVLVPMIPG